MRLGLFAVVLPLLVCAGGASADSVLFSFFDPDIDSVFDVFVRVDGDSAGLATYNIALSGLADSPIDATTIDFVEAPLSTLAELTPPFGVHGFSNGLLKGNVGVDGYSAVNSQFNNPFAVYGVGQSEVSVTGALGDTLTFGASTFLGTLTIPGSDRLTDADLFSLLAPNAALFTEAGNSGLVEQPTDIAVRLMIPEPAAGALLLVAAACLRSWRRV